MKNRRKKIAKDVADSLVRGVTKPKKDSFLKKVKAVRKKHRKSYDMAKAAESNLIQNAKPNDKFKATLVTSSSPHHLQNASCQASKKTPAQLRLQAARFRLINEFLYTNSSTDVSLAYKEDPDMVTLYFQGYKEQVSKWPVDPLDKIIAWVKRKSKSEIVADMGCGEGRLANSVKNKVYSFDLAKLNDRVIQTDIANVPLDDQSVDIVVFCLSLMNSNIPDFILEANRILKTKGLMKVAEVKSRFERLGSFSRALRKLGFEEISRDSTNKMFVLFEYEKVSQAKPISCKGIELKPCLYKKR